MMPIVNIAAYKFAEIPDLRKLQSELRNLCKSAQLRGTILVSPEGINLFIAGSRSGIDAVLQHLRNLPTLADLEVKESCSEEQPFNRMLVKIKREIIAFGIDEINPKRYRAASLPPAELKRLLDAGEPITLLDTRNNFEVETGTFKNALAIGIEDFREFPDAVKRLPEELKSRPLITFCTGGIRCEKAAPYLEREGFTKVFQLDGGILKYFEQCGGAHYEGDCFVFDKRVALDPELKPSGLQQCFVCQAILTPEEQASPKYVIGESCPHCYKSDEQSLQQLLVHRHEAIRHATTPLPGSVPYENVRPISVPLRLDGYELLDFLDAMHTHLSRDLWRAACTEDRLACRGEAVRPGRMMRAGERLLHKMPATREPDVATNIQIIHEDDAIVVINKPAPLPMHPCGRFNRNSLLSILETAYHPLKLRPAHRLDADTTGIVVFTKRSAIARILQPQFESGQAKKTYIARVHGHPADKTFTCCVPLATRPGKDGIRLPDENGTLAETRFTLLKRLDDDNALLEIEPLTGRTNQIRAHLWHLGLPVVGDPIYLQDHQLGKAQSLSIADPPLCLHAAAIEFNHPTTEVRRRFTAPAVWM